MEKGPTRSQEFSADSARASLDVAALVHGLDGSAPQLLRLGENAVFSMSDDVVARVMRPSQSAAKAAQLVAVARWLEDSGVSVVEPLPLDQPVEANGLLITFWRSLGDAERYGSTVDLARLLRRLHGLDRPPDMDLPAADPVQRARRRLDESSLPSNDVAFLSERLTSLRDRYDRVVFDLPPAVIHDDANVGNVLIDQEGTPRLIDLDGVAFGPREWDLILTAIYFDRYGWHTREEYEAFVEVYGFDVMQWAGYEVLADLRELIMVTWMSQNIGSNEKTADEFAKRMHALRTGGSRRDWSPF